MEQNTLFLKLDTKSKVKKEEILLKERERFITNSVKKGIDQTKAEKVYNLILKFAEYGFNRAHSVAYSRIAYNMAYLKANYYKYFMKNLLTMVSGSDKTSSYIYECKEAGLEILKPSVLTSDNNYKVEELGLRFPLSAIKNLGINAVNTIVNERENGVYKDIFDFVKRVYGKSVNKKTLESLAYAGTLSSFGYNIKTIINNLDVLTNYAELAGSIFDDDIPKPSIDLYPEYSKRELLEYEFETFGFYLSNHIITEYRSKYNNHIMIKDIEAHFDKNIKLIVYVERLKEVNTKSNNKMLFVTGSDEMGKIDLVLFPTVYSSVDEISKGNILLVDGRVEKRFDKYQIVVNKVIDQIID